MKPLTTIIILLTTLIYGANLQAKVRYELECDPCLKFKSGIYLLLQVGVKEKSGRNDGKEIAKYLRSVGIDRPAPYCAAGQYWCFDAANQELDKEIPLYKTGVAIQFLQQAKIDGKRTIYEAHIGDLLVWKRPNSWQGHVERIIEVGEAGWVLTVGFNTSNGKSGSQREGNGVFIRRRNIYHAIGRLKVYGIVGFKTM